MRQSPFALKAGSDRKEIERYSDKYKQFRECEIDNFIEWRPDWKFFPEELRINVKQRKRQLVGGTKPNLQAARKRARTTSDGEGNAGDNSSGREEDDGKKIKKVTFSDKDKLDTLDAVVKEDKGDEEEGEGEGEEVTEEVYDEEIEEEDTDYNVTYFDNGEDYGGEEEEALEEGPCY